MLAVVWNCKIDLILLTDLKCVMCIASKLRQKIYYKIETYDFVYNIKYYVLV